jgi:3-hydroxybutyryl-CoA dehydratase
MLTRWFEDYSVGDTGTTRGRTVTETDLVGFAGVSGDFNPLHTDQVYAESTRFGQRIAHGMLVLSIATGLIELKAPYAAAFYGIDGLRFLAPTFIGDTLTVTWTVTEKKDHSSTNGLIAYQVAVLKQDGTECVRGTMTLLARKSR